MQYRVRYSLWTISASSPEEAKKKAVEMMKSSAENLITVEVYRNKKPFWYRVLTGK